MIYGIRQIEELFPGFEARWTGGILYDLREVFLQHKSYDINSEVLKMAEYVADNFWDLVRPPSSKMYIIVGNKPLDKDMDTGAKGFYGNVNVEYAVHFGEFKDDRIRIKELYVSNKYVNIQNPTNNTKSFKYVTRHTGFDVLRNHESVVDSMGIHRKTIIWPPREIWSNDYSFIKNTFGDATYNRFMSEGHSESSLGALVRLATDDIICFAPDIKIALFYLNVRNIKQVTNSIPKHKPFYYPKIWGNSYKTLSLTNTLTDSNPHKQIPTGITLRGHFCRGHFKRKKTGVYWWNAQWRGDFSKGIVMKDYKLKVSNS